LERYPAEGRGNTGWEARCYPDFRRLALSFIAYVTGRLSGRRTAVGRPDSTRQKPLRTCNSVPRERARGHLGVAERTHRSPLIASPGPRSCGLPFQQVPRGGPGATWGSAKAGRRASGASESARPSARVRVRSAVRTIPCTCGKVPPEVWKPNGRGPRKVVSL